jgi:5-carboxymethyl-2-hydroxymuconate isomerase
MPHLIIECGARLSPAVRERILRDAHGALLSSGEVVTATDLKSRMVVSDSVLIGVEGADATFVHAELRILAGRSTETRQELARMLLRALTQTVDDQVEASVEVRELADDYVKRTEH